MSKNNSKHKNIEKGKERIEKTENTTIEDTGETGTIERRESAKETGSQMIRVKTRIIQEMIDTTSIREVIGESIGEILMIEGILRDIGERISMIDMMVEGEIGIGMIGGDIGVGKMRREKRGMRSMISMIIEGIIMEEIMRGIGIIGMRIMKVGMWKVLLRMRLLRKNILRLSITSFQEMFKILNLPLQTTKSQFHFQKTQLTT